MSFINSTSIVIIINIWFSQYIFMDVVLIKLLFHRYWITRIISISLKFYLLCLLEIKIKIYQILHTGCCSRRQGTYDSDLWWVRFVGHPRIFYETNDVSFFNNYKAQYIPIYFQSPFVEPGMCRKMCYDF